MPSLVRPSHEDIHRVLEECRRIRQRAKRTRDEANRTIERSKALYEKLRPQLEQLKRPFTGTAAGCDSSVNVRLIAPMPSCLMCDALDAEHLLAMKRYAGVAWVRKHARYDDYTHTPALDFLLASAAPRLSDTSRWLADHRAAH